MNSVHIRTIFFHLSLILICFGWTADLSAQRPWPSTDARWCSYCYDDWTQQWYPGDVYHQVGKTTIDDHLYYSLFRTDHLNNTPTYIGAFREDSARRVYYRPLGDSTDLWLYDFGVNSGDTVMGIDVSAGAQRWVDNLICAGRTSVNIAGGAHDFYYMALYGTQFTGHIYVWIEGIGDQHNPIAPIPGGLVSGHCTVGCFWLDGVVHYDGGWCSGLNVAKALAGAVEIGPVPAKTEVRVKWPEAVGPVRGTLTGLGGRKLREWAEMPERFSVEGLPAGVYLLELRSEEMEVSRRLVVE
ncbi:MAG: hypothetical protein AAF570_28710 [Bacteroidota bacterium]